MALYSFRLPDIGEGIAEAEIVAWHIEVGDLINEDSPIADMMTDKATVEMESPVSGRIVSLAGEVGDMISIGATLVAIETEGDEIVDPIENEAADLSEENISPIPDEAVLERKTQHRPLDVRSGTDAIIASGRSAFDEEVRRPRKAKVLASPAVRSRAIDLGIDLAQVPTETERVRHSDLDAYCRYGAAQGYGVSSAGPVRDDQSIKLIGLRRKIAENMAASKRSIPHFSYVEEVNVTSLEELRFQLNESRGGRPKLTMLPFLITAICKVLPDYPMVNARFDDEKGIVTQYGAVHLGVATQTQSGLMVPVIRDAQNMNIWQLAKEIKRVSEAARDGSARPQELSGSTLTVTSLGPLGGIATTPVINRPEVAIIGPNKIVERPIFVRNEQGFEDIRKAKLMNISISCDHRVVDGWDAAHFTQQLKLLLEAPAILLSV